MPRIKTYYDPAGRVCTRCDEYKLWEFFYPKKGGLNAKDSECIECDKKRRKGAHQHKTERRVGNRNPRADGYVDYVSGNKKSMVHRVVMEIIQGRELESWEEVHHLNGIRSDNHYDNLELWCKPQPSGQRVEDLVEWVVRCYPEMVKEILTNAVSNTEG